MSEQRAPQQNGCQCGMCFFLAMEGSKYCVAHRGIMEAFDRKRAASLPESQPSPRKEETMIEFLIKTNNPDATDKTIQQLGAALVGGGMPQGYEMVDGCYVARVFGDPGYFEFACKNQGYCEIVGRRTR